MRRFLFDTAVFLYARGTDHPYRQSCRSILEAAARGEIAGEASVELVQEYAYVRLRRSAMRAEVAIEARALLAAFRAHAVEAEDVTLALSLMVDHERLSPRDAIHAATALRRDIPLIVSPDRAFDDVTGVERIDPTHALDVIRDG